MQNGHLEISDLPFRDRFVAAYKMYASGVTDISSFFAIDGSHIANNSITCITSDTFANAMHSFSIKSIVLGGYQGLTQEEAVIISDFFDESSFAASKDDDALIILSKILEAAPLEKNANKCFDGNSHSPAFEHDTNGPATDTITMPLGDIDDSDLHEILECSNREHSIIKDNYYQMLGSCGENFSRPKIFNMARNFLASVKTHFEHEERLIRKFDETNLDKHCDEHVNIILSISVLIDEIQVSIVSETLFINKVKHIEERIMSHAAVMDALLMEAIFHNAPQAAN